MKKKESARKWGIGYCGDCFLKRKIYKQGIVVHNYNTSTMSLKPERLERSSCQKKKWWGKDCNMLLS
jgi:hypothetical protein